MTTSSPSDNEPRQSSLDMRRAEMQRTIQEHLGRELGTVALGNISKFTDSADEATRRAAFVHVAKLLSLLTGETIESEPTYEPNPNLPRFHQFINVLCQDDTSERLQLKYNDRQDMSAIVNALIELNTPLDPRVEVKDMANVIGLAFQGLTDVEIAEVRGTNRTAISQRLSKIRTRTLKLVEENPALDPIT